MEGFWAVVYLDFIYTCVWASFPVKMVAQNLDVVVNVYHHSSREMEIGGPLWV